MQTKRVIGYAPKTQEVASRLPTLAGPCIGCKECTGLCQELIDALTLPEVIVRA